MTDEQALSNAHAYLFEERERLLSLQAENDELRLQEREDRRQIKHLLALTQPTQQEITYHQDSKPRAVTAFAHEPGHRHLPPFCPKVWVTVLQ